MKEIPCKIKYKILVLLIVVSPCLEPYKYMGIDLDTLVLLFTIIYSWVFVSNKWNTKNYSLPFLLYGLIVPSLISIIYGYDSNIKSSVIVLMIYALVLVLVINNISLHYFIKYYRIMVYLAIVVFILQEMMYMRLGYRFSALIPFLDLKYDFTTMHSFILTQMYYPRSSSFFLEPSHFAQYLLPYFAYALGRNTDTIDIKKYIEPIILLIVFFFLKSGCGIAGAMSIVVFYIIFCQIHPMKKVLIIIVAIIIFPILYSRILESDTGRQIVDRMSELEQGGDYERSGSQRIYRGFYVYGTEDPVLQMFGVGAGGCIDIINKSSARVMFNSNEYYLNNMHILLIGFGLVGTFLFILYLFTLFKNSQLDGRLILIGFFTLCFLESFFLTSKMILYIAFVYSLIRQHDLLYKN